MRRLVRGLEFRGRMAVPVLMAVTLLVALVAPVGLRTARAQDSVSIQTRVQVLHAATDLGKVEVYFNGDKKLDEFKYGETSDWIDLDPGTVRVTVARDRAGFNYSVFDVVYPVPAGNDYYLVISDALVLGSAADRSPLPEGMARVRITHASVDSPAINVNATQGNLSLATQLAYGQSSDYTEVPAGTFDAEITLADSGQSVLTLPSATIEAGMSYEFVVIGTPGDDDKPLEVKTFQDSVTGAGATPTA